ncbi:MAG: hypothetical protein ACREXR_02605 [Gammaproteobacteria bacterium]
MEHSSSHRETEQWLGEAGFKSQIHYKGQRGKPLSVHKKRLNRLRSTIRARVDHVFGFQHNSMGRKLIRTIGLARAKTKIALMNGDPRQGIGLPTQPKQRWETAYKTSGSRVQNTTYKPLITFVI